MPCHGASKGIYRTGNFMGNKPSIENQSLMGHCARLPIWILLSQGDHVDSFQTQV